jgi:thimet oligopeptidase
VIGRFFLDMHPRDGKFKHAAEFSIMTGVEGYHLPLSALVCNFPGGDGTEGLMGHGQVETFLHEFGHLIHDMFAGSQKWVGVSGISTEWDFVEAPSQMLEEWIWDKETLQRFAVNEEGQVIPDELVEKMNAARDFGRGIGALQQMFYASVSLNYYNRDPATFELLPMLQALQEKYSPYEFLEGTHMFANFGHLFGYSAIYYTYMWSQVIALDMFSRFEEEGIRNTNTAMSYREKVLSPGGSRDAADLPATAAAGN